MGVVIKKREIFSYKHIVEDSDVIAQIIEDYYLISNSWKIIKFAYFPVKLGSNKIIWLIKYVDTQWFNKSISKYEILKYKRRKKISKILSKMN